MTTPQLPTDVFRLVFVHLEADEIRVVRKVCKDFYDLSNLRSVWSTLLQKHVIQQNIPIPGLYERPLELLSARELEHCLDRALALRKNWISKSPIIHRRRSLEAIPQHRIVSIQFLPGNGRPRLFSLSMSQNRTFTIQCWDLQGQTPTCIASRELLRFRGAVVNKVVSDSGTVAVLNPDLEILSLGLETSDLEHGFATSMTVISEDIHGLHSFFGTSLLTRDRNGRLYVWDINRPQIKVELQNPGLVQNTAVVDVVITQGSIMVLRQTTIELYPLPYPIPTFSNSAIFRPVYVLSLPGRVDSGVMTTRCQPKKTDLESIYIVVRYGSLFPWALNILHHYEIHTNPFFSKDRPMSPVNLPYSFPAVLQETIAAPVRLHATSDLVIGEHGTIVWTDSHTEDYFNHADRGQRLAGRFAPFAGETGTEDEYDLPSQIATAMAEIVYDFHEEDSWVRVALDEREGIIALGRDDGLISVLEPERHSRLLKMYLASILWARQQKDLSRHSY